MKDDQHRFLALSGTLPGRITADQVAWILNCQSHDVPVLVATRLLRPLGNPQPNSVKYFATIDVVEHAKDPAWLAKMTNAIALHWRTKNEAKRRQTDVDLSLSSQNDLTRGT